MNYAGTERGPIAIVVLEFMNERKKLWLIREVWLERDGAVTIVAHVQGLYLSWKGPVVYANTFLFENRPYFP